MNSVRNLLTHAVANQARKRGWFDLRYGLALMRDRSVPVSAKIAALGLGFVLMLIVQALEFPLEAMLDAMMALLGTPFFIALDGLEFIALPILFAAAILPRIARPTLR